MKPAAFLGLILLVLPFASRADENLVARRELCRQEARVSIIPKGKVGVAEYQRIVERRNAHVDQCMTRAFGVLKQVPLPPKKELPKGLDTLQETRILTVKKKSRRVAQRVERRRPKNTSARMRGRRQP